MSDTPVQMRMHRRPLSGTIVVASDGATGVQAVAYAAVLADEEGVFADPWSSVRVADPYPWAVEWLGRYLGLWALRNMNLPGVVKVWAAADGAHAATEGEDMVWSASPLVDRIRVRYAQQLHAGPAKEVYVPAEGPRHGARAQEARRLPDLQREAHVLAT